MKAVLCRLVTGFSTAMLDLGLIETFLRDVAVLDEGFGTLVAQTSLIQRRLGLPHFGILRSFQARVAVAHAHTSASLVERGLRLVDTQLRFTLRQPGQQLPTANHTAQIYRQFLDDPLHFTADHHLLIRLERPDYLDVARHRTFFESRMRPAPAELTQALGVPPGGPVRYFPRRGFDLWGARYFILPTTPLGWESQGRGIASFLAETERIYLFLVPFMCLAAAPLVKRPTLLAAALATQAVVYELLFDTLW